MSYLLLLAVSFSAFCVDRDSIAERYALVGVVGDPNNGGIAVIKDIKTNKSLKLRQGQLLPYDAAWVVTKIENNGVVLKQQSEKIRITHANLPAEAKEPEKRYDLGRGLTYKSDDEEDDSESSNIQVIDLSRRERILKELEDLSKEPLYDTSEAPPQE